MSFINTRTGGAIAVAAATGAAAVLLAGPATADEKLITEKYIASEECATVGAGQLCPANPANYFPTRTQFLARTPAIEGGGRGWHEGNGIQPLVHATGCVMREHTCKHEQRAAPC